MDTKKIETISWAHCDSILLQKAQSVWGNDIFSSKIPTDFAAFIDALTSVPFDVLTFWLANLIEHCGLQDFTDAVLADESVCLFMTANKSAKTDMIDIISERLLNFYIPAEWCYLDDQKCAVAHFVKREDASYFVGLYCLGTSYSSYLHLVSNGYQKVVIPVAFVDEKTLAFYRNQVEMDGGFLLRDYLPRDKFGFLSRRCYSPTLSEKKVNERPNYSLDRGDML